MSTYFPGGLGGTGAALATAPYLTLLGSTRVWYVDSVTGVNGAAPAGASRERPLLTLAQAVTNASAGDIIVLLSTHNETIGANVAVNKKNLTIVGEGTTSGGIPSASITPYSAADSITVSAAGVMFQHVRFKARTDANLHATIAVTAGDCLIDDCYFESDEFTNEGAIQVSGTYNFSVNGTTFVSTETSTSLANAPFAPLALTTVGEFDVNLRNCVFDGGQTGFKNSDDEPSALELSGDPLFYIESASLLRGAELHLGMSGGYAHVPTVSGGGAIRSSTNVKSFHNGFGATSGTDLATAAPLIVGGNVWYVDSVTGADEAGAGTDRRRPFATLQEAVDQSNSGDIIVLLATHNETIAAGIVISARLTILGEGFTDGIPTATLRMGHATDNMLTSSALRLSIRGVRFAPPTTASTGSYFESADAEFELEDCYVEMNGFNGDYGFKLPTGVGLSTIRGTTFVSTATSHAAKPYPAVYAAAGSDSNVRIYDSTFDAGSYGFENASADQYAFEGGSSTHYRIVDTEFLNGADLGLGINTGYVGVTESSGSMRIIEENPA